MDSMSLGDMPNRPTVVMIPPGQFASHLDEKRITEFAGQTAELFARYGLTVRESIAVQIMAGLAGDAKFAEENVEEGELPPEVAAEIAILWADALIARFEARRAVALADKVNENAETDKTEAEQLKDASEAELPSEEKSE